MIFMKKIIIFTNPWVRMIFIKLIKSYDFIINKTKLKSNNNFYDFKSDFYEIDHSDLYEKDK